MTTYERNYGTNYEATKNYTSKEVAAHMRRVIRQAHKDGLLPEEYQFSVQMSKSSMSTAIDILIVVPDEIEVLRQDWYNKGDRPNYTSPSAKYWIEIEPEWEPLAKLASVEGLLTEIHQSYNYDGSDSMVDYFDVRFYGYVKVISRDWWDRFYSTKKGGK